MWTMVPATVFASLIISISSGDTDSGIDELRREMDALRTYVKQQLTWKHNLSTSYVRWGRTTCEGSATVVYKGYAAGPRYTAETGSGSNYLCLHESPQWNVRRVGADWTGSIYGVQYETWEISNNVFSFANNDGQELAPNPGPCVVCNVPNRSTVVLIPARTECPPDWHKEYGGYVITSARTYVRSSYICWDEAPETAPGGHNVDQAVIYPTKVRCGTLPCAIYEDERELTCVVCSK